MSKRILTELSRRERQIMDIIYENGSRTVSEVRAALPDPPSYSTVRALLRVLEEKGYLKHSEQGAKYVYAPTIGKDRARTSALKHLMQTFFENSTEDVVAALMDIQGSRLSEEDFAKLQRLIEKARKEGR